MSVTKRRTPHITGRKRAACYLAIAAGLALIWIGTAGLSLGGYAFFSTLFGNTEGLAFPWWPFFPGLILFYAGGAIGMRAMNLLEFD